MSTIAYAALTTKREESAPGTSQDKQTPGLRTYVDAFAALVTAEVLTVHALIISATTSNSELDNKIQIIDGASTTLLYSFWGLILLSIVLYVVPRLKNGNWDRLDFLRAAIPALAFVGWTMLQRMTAFDAIDPGVKRLYTNNNCFVPCSVPRIDGNFPCLPGGPKRDHQALITLSTFVSFKI